MPKWVSEIFTYILIVLKHLWIISILSYYEIQLLVVLCIQMHFCIQLLCFAFILVQSDDYLKKLTQFDPSVKEMAITGGEVTLQAWPVKWQLIRMPQIITPLCFCRDVSWRKCGKHFVFLAEGTQCKLLSVLTSNVSTLFPFLFGGSVCVKRRDSRVDVWE